MNDGVRDFCLGFSRAPGLRQKGWKAQLIICVNLFIHNCTLDLGEYFCHKADFTEIDKRPPFPPLGNTSSASVRNSGDAEARSFNNQSPIREPSGTNPR